MLKNLNKYKVVLASQSPRRKELLSGIGVCFESISLDIDESVPEGLQPIEEAVYLSNKKADYYVSHYPIDDVLVITADTIVDIAGDVLNKPKNKEEAFEMLSRLSGKSHDVITGVTITTSDQQISFHEISSVHFKFLSKEEINYYIDNYNPMDKAGAYGIQEWIGYIGIDSIQGSYFNVMGLPTKKLYEYLKLF